MPTSVFDRDRYKDQPDLLPLEPEGCLTKCLWFVALTLIKVVEWLDSRDPAPGEIERELQEIYGARLRKR